MRPKDHDEGSIYRSLMREFKVLLCQPSSAQNQTKIVKMFDSDETLRIQYNPRSRPLQILQAEGVGSRTLCYAFQQSQG